jgi:hypothetical protein
MSIPRPSVTTSGMKSKGPRCMACRKYAITTTRAADGKMKCDDCLPPGRRSLIERAPAEEV